MKNSKIIFFSGSAFLFLWIIGGFNPFLSWEHRLFKIIVVSIIGFIAWSFKNSKKTNKQTTGLVIVLLLAATAAYAEPYASDLLFGHHQHHFYCGK
ncbi:MAG: hypothetical protein RLN90_09385 [Balneolaceae bacterium]